LPFGLRHSCFRLRVGDHFELSRALFRIEPVRCEPCAVDELRRREILFPQEHDGPRLFGEDRRQLHGANAERRIEQQRHHDDHEPRPAVAQLIADLALKNEPDVSPLHHEVSAVLGSEREINSKNSSSMSVSWCCSASSRMVPAARIFPRWIMAIRSQSFSTSRMMCVEKMMHFPWSFSSAIVRSTARATSTSNPE